LGVKVLERFVSFWGMPSFGRVQSFVITFLNLGGMNMNDSTFLQELFANISKKHSQASWLSGIRVGLDEFFLTCRQHIDSISLHSHFALYRVEHKPLLQGIMEEFASVLSVLPLSLLGVELQSFVRFAYEGGPEHKMVILPFDASGIHVAALPASERDIFEKTEYFLKNPKGLVRAIELEGVCLRCGPYHTQRRMTKGEDKVSNNYICESCHETWYASHCHSCLTGRVDSRDPGTSRCATCNWLHCDVCHSCRKGGCKGNILVKHNDYRHGWDECYEDDRSYGGCCACGGSSGLMDILGGECLSCYATH
tara:strand:+ start:2354 stop:3280 length:927 start_codon:yes stop_codon:yes gene_type:complete